MKIEIELDDLYYRALRELLGEDIDPGVVLSEMLKVVIITFGADPEAFLAAYGNHGTSEERWALEDRFKEAARIIWRKAQK